MKTTIETTHRITIKGQTLDLTTKELEELYRAAADALCKRHEDSLAEIRRLFEQQRQNQERPIHTPNPFVPSPKYWGDDKWPYEIPPIMCENFVSGPSLSEIASVAVSATTEGRQDVTTDSSKQYVGSNHTALTPRTGTSSASFESEVAA